jgi:2-keto-4-pentenoate hydratase/2-oxohepta-3-ene-1,7-dioic acid hydratase in catechol pathway
VYLTDFDFMIHRDQLFNVRQTIAFLSQGTTLLPGSVIMTGTPKGVGFVKKPPIYLKNGDSVTVWVGNGIGSLVNPVIEEGAPAVKAKL